MKALSNIRYILFAISILGLFATFAQDEYGNVLTAVSNGFIMLVSLIITLLYERVIWKRKKSATLFVLGSIVALFLFPVVVIIFGMDSNALWFLLIVPLFTLAELIWVMIENRKKEEPSDRFRALESLGVLFLFTGTFFKYQHYPGANVFLILSGLIFLLLYLPRALIVLFRKAKKEVGIALFSLLFYVEMILGSLTYVFKYQHYPYATILDWITVVTLGILVMPLLFRLKLKHGAEKISAGKYIGRLKGSTMFFFIFVNYFAIYAMLANVKVLPNINSLRYPPVLQKMLDENSPDADAYMNNLSGFTDARYNGGNNKK